ETEDLIELGDLHEFGNPRLQRRHPEFAARPLQSATTHHEDADAHAIDVAEFGKIEHNFFPIRTNQIVDRPLHVFAVPPQGEPAGDVHQDDVRFDGRLLDAHECLVVFG